MAYDFYAILSHGTFTETGATDSQWYSYAVSHGFLDDLPAPSTVTDGIISNIVTDIVTDICTDIVLG